MIRAKHIFTVVLFSFFYQSCSTKPDSKSFVKIRQEEADKGKKYVVTIYQDKINSAGNKFEPNNRIETLTAANDTVAYLTALKRFYNQKIVERQHFNYGQPKSFAIVDANGVDLKVNLSDRIVSGLKNQVENTPNVKKMLEEYQKDSL